jgi:HD-GYP domain-containing protein (c-di-GMP phosphodiesterase class II)
MKKHVDIGYDILKNKQIDNRIREAALFHHEKCDGSGYPIGLSGDKIPTFAKILAVADIYDALTADRIYRKAVCPFTAIRMLEEDSFTKLDPKYTLPFLRNVVSSYIHNNVKLDNGEIGEVVMINDRNLSRPIVKINNRFIDLSTEPKRSIIAIV